MKAAQAFKIADAQRKRLNKQIDVVKANKDLSPKQIKIQVDALTEQSRKAMSRARMQLYKFQEN